MVLDEPTNHLDIASQEILEEVLSDFRGTILLVSHDRQFVDSLATQVWLIQGRRLVTFAGNYGEYLASLEANQATASSEAALRKADAGRRDDEERRERLRKERRAQREERRRQERVSELESGVARLEGDLAALGRQLEQASVAQRTGEVFRLGRQYQAAQDELNRLLEEWAESA